MKGSTRFGLLSERTRSAGATERKSGSKAECLDYIKEVWTDMRPLSLRKSMEKREG